MEEKIFDYLIEKYRNIYFYDVEFIKQNTYRIVFDVPMKKGKISKVSLEIEINTNSTFEYNMQYVESYIDNEILKVYKRRLN